jgi:hypothetical protein
MICWTQNITFDAGLGYESYLWNTGDTLQTLFVDSNNFSLGSNIYSVIATDSFQCIGIDSIVLMIDPCTGIITHVIAGAEIDIFPNPNNGRFRIKIKGIENQLYELGVFNAVGNKVFGDEITIESQSAISREIDLSSYPNGIYYLRLYREGQIKVKKIIIQ